MYLPVHLWKGANGTEANANGANFISAPCGIAAAELVQIGQNVLAIVSEVSTVVMRAM